MDLSFPFGRALRSALALAAILLLTTDAVASSPDLQWNGQVRVRTNTGDRAFVPDDAVRNDTELRSRLGFLATVGDNASAYIQLQDSRVLGGTGATGAAASGTLNDGANVDVHQAWVRVNRLIGERVGLRAGRFEVNLGNQRVFGAVGWDNVGRSWEGITLETRPADGWQGDLHWLKKLELDDAVENRDFDVVVAAVKSPHGIEGFAALERDGDASAGAPDRVNALNRWTVGAYVKRAGDNVDMEANIARQGGERETTAGGTEQKIGATLATLEIGVPLKTKRPARLAAGVDFASGDSTPDMGKYSAYDNLYYTGHKFRGFLDYFLGSGPEGLVDWMVRASLQPADGWVAKVDWHLFQTAEDRAKFGGGMTKEVGQEIDLVLKTSRVEGVSLEAVSGLFFASDTFAGVAGPDTGWYTAFLLTTNFSGGVSGS